MSRREAFIAGVGMSSFAKQPSRTIEEIGRIATSAAIADSGIDPDEIEEVLCGSSFGGSLIGQRVLRDMAMTGRPVTNVENACSGGASALRLGLGMIGSGAAETVLVLGVEKLTALGGGALPLERSDIEVRMGVNMPAVYAMRAGRYMKDYGATPEHLAMVSVKARQAAALNPHAQIRTLTTVDEVLASRPVADPLTLFMCCPVADGAAALVLTSKRPEKRSVRVAASVLQSGKYKTGFRDMSSSELTRRSVAIAYDNAGVGPADIDMAEVHDAFTIAELLYYEGLGFCGLGEGKDFLAEGHSALGGSKPVNPSGGLLSKGHPVGATGIAQVCEAVWQLRGEAGDRQVAGAKTALTHCTGGGIAGFDHGACAIHILES